VVVRCAYCRIEGEEGFAVVGALVVVLGEGCALFANQEFA
jgi:hypothetical protein